MSQIFKFIHIVEAGSIKSKLWKHTVQRIVFTRGIEDHSLQNST